MITRQKERSFVPQDNVYVRKAGSKSPWIPGTIFKRNGNVHYDVKLDDQRIVRKHIEHVQPRITTHVEVPQQQQSEEELSDSLEVPCSHDLTPTSSQLEEPTTPDVVGDTLQTKHL